MKGLNRKTVFNHEKHKKTRNLIQFYHEVYPPVEGAGRLVRLWRVMKVLTINH